MALDGTLTGLKASVASFLNRADADVLGAIPDFIALAESQMSRRLRCRRMVARFYAVVPASSEFVDLPSDFIGPLDMMTGGEPQRRLKYLEPDSLANLKATRHWCDTDCTQYYSIVGNTLRFLPVPPSDMTVELVYWMRVPALTDAAPSNWVLTDNPDIYLYGALTQSAPYLKDDSRTTVWGTLFTQAIADCNANDPVPGDTAQLRTEITRCQLGLSGGPFGPYYGSDSNFDC